MELAGQGKRGKRSQGRRECGRPLDKKRARAEDDEGGMGDGASETGPGVE